MGSDLTCRADRERHVVQMLASSRLEGLEPDEAHQQLLQEYIEGAASLDNAGPCRPIRGGRDRKNLIVRTVKKS